MKAASKRKQDEKTPLRKTNKKKELFSLIVHLWFAALKANKCHFM
jgi:hypothetical protein